jgi:hypothetical protein
MSQTQRRRPEKLNATDREDVLSRLDLAEVDFEFRPFIERINVLPFVVTTQSCVGHIPYGKAFKKRDRPPQASKRWGYLQLLVTTTVADWLHEQARARDWEQWIWIQGSQLFAKKVHKLPQLTKYGDGYLTFAWDAKHWPHPAFDITAALEDFATSRTDGKPEENRDQCG